ncbi:MAG: hypothetical protein L0H38_03530 [bacterium]|nr:hypothetical protein [bacterium]
MFNITNLLRPFIILITLSTAASVFIHDSSIDKMTAAVAAPAIILGAGFVLDGNSHPHAGEHSLSQATRDMQSHSPRVRPRDGRENKYKLSSSVPKGRHPFDNYNLPVIS